MKDLELKLREVVEDHNADFDEEERKAQAIAERLATEPDNTEAHLELCLLMAHSYRRQADIIEANIRRIRRVLKGEEPS